MLIIQLREFFIYFNTGKYKRKILPVSPYVHVFVVNMIDLMSS